MRDVTLVVGAPCSGKTTYVAQRSQPGDLIVDWDRLAIEAGSMQAHGHEQQYRAAANAARKQLEQRIADTPDIRAWVIRTLPNPLDRTGTMQRLEATRLEVIDPGVQTCLTRARLDGRDPEIDAVILKWYGYAWGARCYGTRTTGTPAAGPNPRHSAQWRRVRAIVLRGRPPCAICHRPMLYGVKFNRLSPQPLYPTVDHIKDVADGGAWFDLANLRPVCWQHNTERASRTGGRRAEPVTAHRTSEDW